VADNAFGDFFLSDVDDELLEDDDELIAAPVVVPAAGPPAPATAAPAAEPAPVPPVHAPAPQTAPAPAAAGARPAAVTRQPSREERLADALNRLMEESQEISAAALVSLDGFTMASALPDGMQEDRVGAMSAAILGLGERAAVELGRGQLSQVFIEGDGGYVMLIAAGDRAVLTCLAETEAKLGLVLYDMRTAAVDIAEILG
jgi:predicted regulator of Ras-like GTPase activity (Roadblock/LC7/MglB family)